MSNHPILGQLITDPAFRDAVHIAIAPVVAAETLRPGQHIGLTNASTNTVSTKGILIGIVDPFLEKNVKAGEQFFMCLYPQTVTNLRHNWSHPGWAFPDVTQTKAGASEEWIRKFADKVNLGYRDLMDGADYYVESGDYLVRGGLLEGQFVPDEFWEHYENVTGNPVDQNKCGSFFSCSC